MLALVGLHPASGPGNMFMFINPVHMRARHLVAHLIFRPLWGIPITKKSQTMKKTLLTIFVVVAALSTANAQKKWDDLTNEEKLLKAQDFRADNQAYLKNTLKLSDAQREDIDNINLCYIAALDRIDRYGKTDETKVQWAKTATAARGAQLDVIMGAENRKKYQEYIVGKLKKAAGK